MKVILFFLLFSCLMQINCQEYETSYNTNSYIEMYSIPSYLAIELDSSFEKNLFENERTIKMKHWFNTEIFCIRHAIDSIKLTNPLITIPCESPFYCFIHIIINRITQIDTLQIGYFKNCKKNGDNYYRVFDYLKLNGNYYYIDVNLLKEISKRLPNEHFIAWDFLYDFDRK